MIEKNTSKKIDHKKIRTFNRIRFLSLILISISFVFFFLEATIRESGWIFLGIGCALILLAIILPMLFRRILKIKDTKTIGIMAFGIDWKSDL